MSIRRNTLINLVGAVVPMVVMLVTVPLYLKILGDARYGVLALVWLVLGYFSFLEMGLGKATANQIAKTHESATTERAEIFWTALLVNGAMGLVAASILWLLGDYLIANVIKMPSDFKEETIAALPWMIATLPLALVSSVLNGALEGRNQFMAVNLLQLVSNTVFQLAPLGIAYCIGPSLALIIPTAVVARATMNIFFFYACYVYLPLKVKPRITLKKAKELFSYGGWVAVTSIAGTLLDTIERFMIGALLGATAVTHYTIPMQVVGKAKIIGSSLARSLFPIFSSASKKESHKIAISATRDLSILMGLITISLIITLRPILEIWIGIETSNIAAPIGEILLLGVWINTVIHIPYFYLQATNRPAWVAKLHTFELIPYVLTSWITMTHYGLTGAAATWTIRCIIEALILMKMAKILIQVLPYIAITAICISTSIIIIEKTPQSNLIIKIPIASAFVLIAIFFAHNSKLEATKNTTKF